MMFALGAVGSCGGVFAGSVNSPSGASHSRNTSSLRNTTRTLAAPADSVYVAPSAWNPVTAPSEPPGVAPACVAVTPSAAAARAMLTTSPRRTNLPIRYAPNFDSAMRTHARIMHVRHTIENLVHGVKGQEGGSLQNRHA